jgi:hypothetical protein
VEGFLHTILGKRSGLGLELGLVLHYHHYYLSPTLVLILTLTYWDRPSFQDSVVPSYLTSKAGTDEDPVAGYNAAGRGFPDVSAAGMTRIRVRVRGRVRGLCCWV